MIQDTHKARRLQSLRLKHRDPDTGHLHPVNKAHYDQATRGARIADELSAAMGSWPFIIVQSSLMLVWVGLNAFGLFVAHWDPYPFILLNLVLSLQATYAGPIVLLAGNRQGQKDRLTLEHASDEADKGEEHITRILVEIRKNTELTLRILQELEAEKA
jgi:uncharacterized membrane protein